MPIGLVRLNERRQRPNKNISFIKTGDGPESEIAMDILERVAAIVWPIMRDNHLGVVTLEDFPPNREFWGRNFNAGEVIQLVLKSPFTGLWLPFGFVCKVMIHEMAHIKQMNHSRYFHQVRIGYTEELNALIADGYTGDGFWSTGNTISTGLTAPRHLSEEEMPTDLCGGAYRKQGRKRKASEGQKLTYQERKQKRKEKLFGKGEGNAIGSDEEIETARRKLEKGKGKSAKQIMTKPRVAQSQRGRDLRAEAAQRRMEALAREAKKAKKEEARAASQALHASSSGSEGKGKARAKPEDDSDVDELAEESGDEREDEWIYSEEEGDTGEHIEQDDGTRLVKQEDGADEAELDRWAREEWNELKLEVDDELQCATPGTSRAGAASVPRASGKKATNGSKHKSVPQPKKEESETESSDVEVLEASPKQSSSRPAKNGGSAVRKSSTSPTISTASSKPSLPATTVKSLKSSSGPAATRPTSSAPASASAPPSASAGRICPACSTPNPADMHLCAVCANVLAKHEMRHWTCSQSEVYANPMDAGRCGCCGERRPSSA